MRIGNRAVVFTGVALAVALLGAAFVPTAFAKRGDPRVYNLKRKAVGKRGKDWATEWWQWALSIPFDHNPLLDETGDRVEVGQRGPVWFLCGVFNESGAATRTATIPSGKALFFPVLNAHWDNVGFEVPFTVDQLRANAAENVADYDLETMKVFLDGSEIPFSALQRIATGPYTFHIPENSIFEVLSGGVYTKGIYAPGVTDGYWCMLRPLGVGEHTLRFTGSSTGPSSFTLDITYELTVVDFNRP